MTFHSLRFDRAAATYGAHSRIQERMAKALIGMLPESGALFQDAADSGIGFRIVELGCGTGNLTRCLGERFPAATLFVTDAAPRMLAAAQAGPGATLPATWLLFDSSGEAPVPDALRAAAPFGLAASNALVQWFPDLRPHLGMAASLLAPRGRYLVSGFLKDNFPELNAILRERPFAYPDYPGHEEKDIVSAAAAAGFAVETYREEAVETVLPSARGLLDTIRGLGSARRPEAAKPLTRALLGILLEKYHQGYACEGGVKATWKPWLARLRKLP